MQQLLVTGSVKEMISARDDVTTSPFAVNFQHHRVGCCLCMNSHIDRHETKQAPRRSEPCLIGRNLFIAWLLRNQCNQ